jgi:hypothetical protein
MKRERSVNRREKTKINIGRQNVGGTEKSKIRGKYRNRASPGETIREGKLKYRR